MSVLVHNNLAKADEFIRIYVLVFHATTPIGHDCENDS
jgi:hypothetical protein